MHLGLQCSSHIYLIAAENLCHIPWIKFENENRGLQMELYGLNSITYNWLYFQLKQHCNYVPYLMIVENQKGQQKAKDTNHPYDMDFALGKLLSLLQWNQYCSLISRQLPINFRNKRNESDSFYIPYITSIQFLTTL